MLEPLEPLLTFMLQESPTSLHLPVRVHPHEIMRERHATVQQVSQGWRDGRSAWWGSHTGVFCARSRRNCFLLRILKCTEESSLFRRQIGFYTRVQIALGKKAPEAAFTNVPSGFLLGGPFLLGGCVVSTYQLLPVGLRSGDTTHSTDHSY